MESAPTGATIICHECRETWPRSEHGLSCPHCDSEFVEIIESEAQRDDIQSSVPPLPTSPPNLDPWTHPQGVFSAFRPQFPAVPLNQVNNDNGQRNGGGVQQRHYQSNNGMFSFTTTTYRSDGNQNAANPGPLFHQIDNLIQAMYAQNNNPDENQRHNYRDADPPNILGGPENLQPRNTDQAQDASDVMENIEELLDHWERAGVVPQTGRWANNPLAAFFARFQPFQTQEYVHTQEELDRIVSLFMAEEEAENGAVPASNEAIRALPKMTIDKSMLDSDGVAECSICMDNAELGSEVTILPCKHWFHDQCISAWLHEHDTCPHCRQGIMAAHRRTGLGSANQPARPGIARAPTVPNTTGGTNTSQSSSADVAQAGGSNTRDPSSGSRHTPPRVRDPVVNYWGFYPARPNNNPTSTPLSPRQQNASNDTLPVGLHDTSATRQEIPNPDTTQQQRPNHEEPEGSVASWMRQYFPRT
ncbi:hypothetical protein FQN57_002833 [Myotisia sp. PD_48]|nr:hypothetical protein FQN57_002833 [Myotisia sp. PD_48]